ncbi:hypothetical protein Taro_053197, partial [Colocasia esculenta]|nr:hypothetical protein [Colocasia esculenta]
MASEQSSSSVSVTMTGGASFGIDIKAPVATWRNLFELSRRHEDFAVLADSSDSETDTVEERRLAISATSTTFSRSGDYRVDFPKDKHLQLFLRSHKLKGKRDTFLIQQIEKAILWGRDNMVGSAPRAEPIYELGGPRLWKPVLGLGELTPENDKLTRAPTFVPARWDNSSGRVTRERSSFGLFLAPLKWGYRDEPYVLDCLAIRFKYQLAVGWFADLRVTDSHKFRAFAVEATEYVLQNYAPILMTAGVYHSVYAARYEYPISRGLCCGLIEVFNSKFNTFYTVEGETSLDLWSLYQLTGLPIDGEPYEEVSLPDPLKDETDGEGRYTLGFSYCYLMKVYRTLFLSYNKGASLKDRKRIRCHMWLEYFFFTEEKYDGFPSVDGTLKSAKKPCQKAKLSESTFKENRRGPNPANVDPCTHCAAYLVYWLCTFAMPNGDNTVIRPEAIYLACQMDWGIRLSLCPAVLCLIYRTLGELSHHDFPRTRRIISPFHFFNAWVCTLFPEFAPRSIQAPLLFPRMLEFASAEPPSTSAQLYDIRGRLTNIPVDSPGTIHFWTLASHSRPLVNRHRECSDYISEEYTHILSGKKLLKPCLEPELRDWALSIRPSVLVFRRGQIVYMEPYYPFRFGRNFGYDQHIPPSSARFFPEERVVQGLKAVDEARRWWDFFHRLDPSTFRVPAPGRTPRVTQEYIKWWNARTGFYRSIKLDCWDKAEQQVLKTQSKPFIKIDKDHLLRLKFNDTKAVDSYIKAMKKSKKQPSASSLLEAKVSIDAFPGTLEHQCKLGTDALPPAAPLPPEESSPSIVSSRSEVDSYFPWRHFVPRAERTPGYYGRTSWLFVLLYIHKLNIESDIDVILDCNLHISFHYAEAWGMDYLSLYYFLCSSGNEDLAALTELCQKINDVCWLVKEAASRGKQPALTYWSLSRLYNGIPASVPETSFPPAKRARVTESSVAVAIKKAIVSKQQELAKEPKSSVVGLGPNIPSFEEFASQSIASEIAVSSIAAAPHDTPTLPMTEEAVALVPEQGAVLEDVPTPSAKGKRQATKVHPPKLVTLQVPPRASSRAAGRLALLKIRGGVRVSPSETPVAISSESSSSTDGVRHISTSGKTKASSDVFSAEKISALEDIGDDSTSSVAAS